MSMTECSPRFDECKSESKSERNTVDCAAGDIKELHPLWALAISSNNRPDENVLLFRFAPLVPLEDVVAYPEEAPPEEGKPCCDTDVKEDEQ